MRRLTRWQSGWTGREHEMAYQIMAYFAAIISFVLRWMGNGEDAIYAMLIAIFLLVLEIYDQQRKR